MVPCKDTPNFIGNRIGTFGGMYATRYALDNGYTVEEVDALTGPLIGRPRTATFRLADLAGVDIMVHVADNLYEAAPDDESREQYRTPELMARLITSCGKWRRLSHWMLMATDCRMCTNCSAGAISIP